MSILSPIITAIRTLTIIPVPGSDARRLSHALPFFPLVGLLYGAVAWGCFQACSYLFPYQYLIIAAALVTVSMVLSGALHLDGLADCADAFGAGRSRGQILDILKDTHLGTFGVCAVVVDILLKVFLYHALMQKSAAQGIWFSLVLSRSFQPLALAFFPCAREQGSMAASFSPGKGVKVAVVILSALSVAACCRAGEWRPAAAMAGAGGVTGLALALFCLKKINGITGDCIGAINETVETAVLAAALFLAS